MKLKDIDWGSVLDGLGTVASVFNPAVGSGLMVASSVADKLDGLDDNFLENNIIGLTRSAEILEDMIEKKEVDEDTLIMVSSNLRSLEKIISKTQKDSEVIK